MHLPAPYALRRRIAALIAGCALLVSGGVTAERASAARNLDTESVPAKIKRLDLGILIVTCRYTVHDELIDCSIEYR